MSYLRKNQYICTVFITMCHMNIHHPMRVLLFCVSLLLLNTTVSADDMIKLEDITSGKFAADNLRSMAPLPDGENFSQLSPDGDKILSYSFKTGEMTGVVFDATQAVGDSITSIDGYQFSPDGRWLMLQTNTERIYRRSYKADTYLYQLDSKRLIPLTSQGKEQVPIWSPDSKRIAFVRDNNIFIVSLDDDMKVTQVTTDGRFNEIINGIPDWVNEEEFSFNCSLTFTKDGKNIAWIKYDESGVKTYSLQLFSGMKPTREEFADYPGEYSYKYPKAGQDNAKVSAWYYEIDKAKTSRFDLPLDEDGYIPRIFCGYNDADVLLCTMNRHQDELCIYKSDTNTGHCSLLISERVPKYIKEEVLAGIIFTNKAIFMSSDRDGFMQVYQYDTNGKLITQVSKAKYGISALYGYDERTKTLFYQAADISPLEREVYATNSKGKTRNLTPRRGWNTARFSGNYQYYVSTWSDMNTPYESMVCNIKGKMLRQVVDNAKLKEKLAACQLPTKEFFSFTTSEGVALNGVMIKPADFTPSRKYPVIMFQYSGPGSQQVVNSWSIGSMGQGGMYDFYLAQRGYIIVCVDGRGTGGRGTDFEKCTYLQLGDLESKDQVETALYLASLPYVDADNIGIWGWSYGGFNTLMSMSEGRPVFKAGVAVAPPTNWRFYDSIYTERFMRTPKENPEGYAVNPIVRASQLHGALLICHGMADDNVHPQNTFEYHEALVQADKDFKELLYTNRNHSIYGGNTRNHLLRQIAQFFFEHLK